MRLQPLEPRRVRYPRGAYGWVDLKVVTGGMLERVGSEAAFTYLFLCAVGNMQGVSCWSTWRTARVLGLALDRVEAAIRKLSEVDLIASNGRVVQVLPLESSITREPLASHLAQASVPRTTSTATRDDTGGADLREEEVRLHEPEALRRLSKITLRPSAERVRRVARALALEVRKALRS